jgi:lambda repressor-like predicted transcriptional regulator
MKLRYKYEISFNNSRCGVTLLAGMHKEDVKAVLRKKFGSVAAFERAHGLATQSVSEVLRGRSSKRTIDAIERVLREHAEAAESITSVDTGASPVFHRLNAADRQA